MDVERAHGVSVERSHEDRVKRARVAREQVEARLGAQLNVEEHHIRPLAAYQRFGLVDAARFAHYVDATLAGEQRAQRAPCEALVVDDDDAQRLSAHRRS